MTFPVDKFNVEDWLDLEHKNLLQKECNIYDTDGLLIEQYKARIGTIPVGTKSRVTIAKFAPALYRSFVYDEVGNKVASIPEMREWSQACEDLATGGSDPLDPTIPHPSIKFAPTNYEYDEQLIVPYNIETTVISFTVPVDKRCYLRNIVGSGDNKGTYNVYIDSVKKQTKRSWWCDFNVNFDFSSSDGGMYVESGKTIVLKVINDSLSAETFDGSIGYVLA